MRLTKSRNDLRHLEPKVARCVGQRGPMTMRITFMSFGGVRPNLNALPRKWCAIAGTTHSARHPKTATANAIHDRGARQIIVGPAPHCWRRGKALSKGRARKARRANDPSGTTCEQELATGCLHGRHGDPSGLMRAAWTTSLLCKIVHFSHLRIAALPSRFHNLVRKHEPSPHLSTTNRS